MKYLGTETFPGNTYQSGLLLEMTGAERKEISERLSAEDIAYFTQLTSDTPRKERLTFTPARPVLLVANNHSLPRIAEILSQMFAIEDCGVAPLAQDPSSTFCP